MVILYPSVKSNIIQVEQRESGEREKGKARESILVALVGPLAGHQATVLDDSMLSYGSVREV